MRTKNQMNQKHKRDKVKYSILKEWNQFKNQQLERFHLRYPQYKQEIKHRNNCKMFSHQINHNNYWCIKTSKNRRRSGIEKEFFLKCNFSKRCQKLRYQKKPQILSRIWPKEQGLRRISWVNYNLIKEILHSWKR